MSLITISTQILSRGLLVPRKRILLSYLVAMIAILSTSGISLYFFVIKSLNQQFNQELLTFVEAAAPSLDTVKREGEESLEQDIPWRNIFAKKQYSLEWYDAEGKLLARKGTNFPNTSLFKTVSPQELADGLPVFERQGHIQTATISIYTEEKNRKAMTLEGYIRASESTQKIEVTLDKLRLGLELGGTTAMVLVSISSIYLTKESVKPIKQGVSRLRRITSDVSHQVRTPLTRISIATDILLSQADKIEPNQAKKLNIINAAVEQIKSLLEELLFLVRTDATSQVQELDFSHVSLMQIVQDVSEKFEIAAQDKGINFKTNISGNILVDGDSVKLTRLFTNLLENSLRYTDPGGNIDFSLESFQKNAIISVRDTGMGIESENLPLIFQGFWRSELAKSKFPEGFGLGLTVAHAIAQQHRGEIVVSSQLGAGSCFQIHLPLS